MLMVHRDRLGRVLAQQTHQWNFCIAIMHTTYNGFIDTFTRSQSALQVKSCSSNRPSHPGREWCDPPCIRIQIWNPQYMAEPQVQLLASIISNGDSFLKEIYLILLSSLWRALSSSFSITLWNLLVGHGIEREHIFSPRDIMMLSASLLCFLVLGNLLGLDFFFFLG